MGTSHYSRMYHFGGELVHENELVEKYAKKSGVTVSIFRNRVRILNWDIERALTTPPSDKEMKPTYGGNNAESWWTKVYFTEPVNGIFTSMQPKLHKVYDARFVKLTHANRSNANASAKTEFVIITLDNGKPLIVYKGEYVECNETHIM